MMQKKKKKEEEERKVKHITTETKNRLESFSRQNETGTRREGIRLLWGVGVPGLKRKEKKEYRAAMGHCYIPKFVLRVWTSPLIINIKEE